MTDLQKFIALYATLGINCKVFEQDGFQRIMFAGDKFKQPNDKTDTGVPKEFWNLSEKVNGYDELWIELVFKDGAFQGQNIWE